MQSLVKFAVGATASFCLIAGAVSPASASTALDATIARQAAQAGLDHSQVMKLQARIDEQMALTPNGRRIGLNQVSWRGGKAVMTFPLPGEKQARAVNEPLTALGSPNCSYQWTCLYEHSNFDGRRLTWSDCGGIIDLSDWGFSDQTTSYHNNQTSGTKTRVYNWTGAWTLLWTSTAPSASSNVGSAYNDKADGIDVC
jgi:hypothetical protein